MKALILNSGLGRRMGDLTANQPKCLTPLATGQTILSRQLAQLEEVGIQEIVITTGPFAGALERHALAGTTSARLTFVNNPDYAATNYIYSIYLARAHLQDDLMMLHGDLVFAADVLADILGQPGSAMAVSTTLPLPQEDFKAVVREGFVQAVGVGFFDQALAAQPLYRLKRQDWLVWLDEIVAFVGAGKTRCYAEEALNAVQGRCRIRAYDVKNRLCGEVDTPQNLADINAILKQE